MNTYKNDLSKYNIMESLFNWSQDEYDDLRKELRDAFEIARKNAKEILDKIRTDFPALTVY